MKYIDSIYSLRGTHAPLSNNTHKLVHIIQDCSWQKATTRLVKHQSDQILLDVYKTCARDNMMDLPDLVHVS